MGIRFKEPKLPSTPCVSFTQTVTCDCFLRMIGPPRTRYSLLDTSYDYYPRFLRYRGTESRAPKKPAYFLQKKKEKGKRIDNRLSTRSDTQRGFLARVIYEPRCQIDSRRIRIREETRHPRNTIIFLVDYIIIKLKIEFEFPFEFRDFSITI